MFVGTPAGRHLPNRRPSRPRRRVAPLTTQHTL